MEVPVRQDAKWLTELRNKMAERGINVKWQKGHFHITLVFIYKIPEDANWMAPLFNCLEYKAAPRLTFDKVDAFASKMSGEHIIHLTSSNPSAEFTDVVNRTRAAIDELGCEYAPEFKLHVTLGRVDSKQIGIEELKQIVSEVNIPSFTLQLFNFRFLEFKTHQVYEKYVMYPDQKSADEAWEERKRQGFRNAFSNIQLFTNPDF